MKMNDTQKQTLNDLAVIRCTALTEALRLRSIPQDEAVWLLVLGNTVRAMQDLRNHQFAD